MTTKVALGTWKPLETGFAGESCAGALNNLTALLFTTIIFQCQFGPLSYPKKRKEKVFVPAWGKLHIAAAGIIYTNKSKIFLIDGIHHKINKTS